MNLNTQNIDTTNRKPLVRALVELLAQPPVYAGPPTYAYKVGDYTITRRGDVIVPDDASEETIQWLKEKLTEKGFSFDDESEEQPVTAAPPEPTEETGEAESAPEEDAEEATDPVSEAESNETDETAPADEPNTEEDSKEESNPAEEDDPEKEPTPETAEESESEEGEAEPEESDEEEAQEDEADEGESEDDESDTDEPDSAPSPDKTSDDDTGETPDDGKTHITLALPLAQFSRAALDRMRAIVASKKSLLKKALDADDLTIEIKDDKVLFPWFTDHGIYGEADAYSKLVFAIARMAITQQRVLATEKPQENEKLAMRLFLIRLDFIGPYYKDARAILTRNFTGNSAWKTGHGASASGFTLNAPEVFNPNTVPHIAPRQKQSDDLDTAPDEEADSESENDPQGTDPDEEETEDE